MDDFSSTVTFWPADVVMVKLDVDTVPTVPDAPPCAGADRAGDASATSGAAVAGGGRGQTDTHPAHGADERRGRRPSTFPVCQ